MQSTKAGTRSHSSLYSSMSLGRVVIVASSSRLLQCSWAQDRHDVAAAYIAVASSGPCRTAPGTCLHRHLPCQPRRGIERDIIAYGVFSWLPISLASR
jgi:hypothetical protein